MPPDNTDEKTTGDEANKTATSVLTADNPEVQALIAQELKDIKEKLNAAFRVRDEAEKVANDLKKVAADAEAARLEKEGKLQEAADVRIKQLLAENAAIEKSRQELADANTVLTRDATIEGMLSTVVFKNGKAKQAAVRDIRDAISKDADGKWVGANGVPLSTVITAYVKDPENAFLFKTSANSGSGTESLGTGTSGSGVKKKLFDLPQAEVIQMALEGKLPG